MDNLTTEILLIIKNFQRFRQIVPNAVVSIFTIQATSYSHQLSLLPSRRSQ